jgi:hypothetical protein
MRPDTGESHDHAGVGDLESSENASTATSTPSGRRQAAKAGIAFTPLDNWISAASADPLDERATTNAARPAPTRIPTSVPMTGRSVAKPAPNPAAMLPVINPAARIRGPRHRSNPAV